MAERTTFIKLDRNIQKWRWYQDANTFRVFVHLLLNANIKGCDFESIKVYRGQVVTTYEKIANSLNLTVQQVRTALGHLKSTGELTVKRHPKIQVITIVCYDRYQGNLTGNLTVKQQSSNSQVTVNQQQSKKEKNYNNIYNSQSVKIDKYIKYIIYKSGIDNLLTDEDDRRLYKAALEFLMEQKEMKTDIGVLSRNEIADKLNGITEDVFAYAFDSVKKEKVSSPVPYIAKTILNALCKG